MYIDNFDIVYRLETKQRLFLCFPQKKALRSFVFVGLNKYYNEPGVGIGLEGDPYSFWYSPDYYPFLATTTTRLVDVLRTALLANELTTITGRSQLINCWQVFSGQPEAGRFLEENNPAITPDIAQEIANIKLNNIELAGIIKTVTSIGLKLDDVIFTLAENPTACKHLCLNL